MSKMKIGLVLPYNITLGGGVAEIVNHTAEGLRARGHTVKIITPNPRKAELGLDNQIVLVGAGTQVKYNQTAFQASATVDPERLERLLDEEKFDILHFHEPSIPFLSRQILSRSKTVNVATFHAAHPETLLSRSVIKAVTPYVESIFKYIDEMSAVSDAAAKYIKSLTDHPIQIIPNGIDLNKYKMSSPRDTEVSSKPTVLYVGRLEKRKGVRYLLKAFKFLQDSNPDARLVIAGDGPEREKLVDLASDLKLKHVTFLGFVTEKKKLDLLRRADLFCAPALHGESFGIVLLEAMAMGLVTVAGNNAGYSAVLKDVGSISLVNPKDSEEFGRRLQMLLQSEGLRKVWQEWASEYVKSFDYKKIIKQYEDFYIKAIKDHGKH